MLLPPASEVAEKVMFSRVCLSTKGVSISDPMSLVGMSKRVSTHPHPLDMGPGGDGGTHPPRHGTSGGVGTHPTGMLTCYS